MISKKSLYTKTGTLLWALAALFAVLPSWPHIYYRVNTNTSQNLANTIASTVNSQTLQDSVSPIPTAQPTPTGQQPVPEPTTNLPRVDPTLPADNGLIIESIGVKSVLHEGDDWQNILRKGIWRVPDFATPLSSDNKPIILAAHRWGYLDWSAAF